jgi:hypothetical protein
MTSPFLMAPVASNSSWLMVGWRLIVCNFLIIQKVADVRKLRLSGVFEISSLLLGDETADFPTT